MDTNHRTRWTVEEIQALQDLWDPTAVKELAELLGRTEDAVRQRHYELTWGTAAQPVSAKELVEGKVASTSSGRRQTDRPLGTVCSSCFVELPLTGVCDQC